MEKKPLAKLETPNDSSEITWCHAFIQAVFGQM